MGVIDAGCAHGREGFCPVCNAELVEKRVRKALAATRQEVDNLRARLDEAVALLAKVQSNDDGDVWMSWTDYLAVQALLARVPPKPKEVK